MLVSMGRQDGCQGPVPIIPSGIQFLKACDIIEGLEQEASSVERPTTILVVDDDAAVRRLVRYCLQRYGHEVVLADSGESALEIFKVCQSPIAAVLTDIMMGGMSGVELADRLHQINPALPIVFMSGYIESGKLGDCAVLRKPFDLKELEQAMEVALNRRKERE
jgi:CheY-like chemotaxis protein